MDLKPSTKIRNLALRERNKLTMILSVSQSWKNLAAVILDPDSKEEYVYKAQDIDILDSQPRPAQAFLEHWSTYGRTQPNLEDLVSALKEANLFRAAHYVQTEILNVPEDNLVEEAVSKKLETVLQAISPSEPVYEIDNLNQRFQGINLSDLTLFPYHELSAKTGHFCPHRIGKGGCKIGEGSYGSVFQANLSGITVAVKLLKERIDNQFFTEINILVRCKHENLLALLGCSIDGPQCCLVYEYMPNGSVQDRLACAEYSPPISSMTRFHIAYCSALGINYLHTFGEKPMVHRDIKSANILLDKNFIPKIGDFGLVRAGGSGASSTMAVTENVFGTSVYMAREAFSGDVSVKLDTFSFGVVLLELLTGLPPYDTSREDRDLITHMESCDDILTKLDSKVMWNSENAKDLYNVAKRCLISEKKKRPTIFEVLPDLNLCCLQYNAAEEWV